MSESHSEQAGERAVLVGVRPATRVVQRQRWAVIVGVSKYQNPDLNLKYAHRDAEALYDLIRTPRGGGFDEERIVKLIDEEATTANVTRALRSFLQKPGREDIVFIYLACHGAPDPNRPQNVYLITHDTDPEDIAGTALPMEYIQNALEPRNLYAERVILIADTCHSAALGGPGRRSIDESAAAHRYLQALSESKPTLAVLTSAEVNQTSREDARWGDGHGVFTYHLLEGLRGKADNNTGMVTVGALFDYVREQVRKDTGDQQHPVIGASAFDRDLVLVVTGDISANDHFRLGCNLMQLGWLLDDKKRFRSAGRHFQEALRFASDLGQSLPEALLYWGQARLGEGDMDGALRAFEQALTGLDGERKIEARFFQIMTRASKGDHGAALAGIDDFLADHPNDWRASWLSAAKSALQSRLRPSRGRALLIGVGKIEAIPQATLRGPANDIDLAQQLLIDRFSFDAAHITRLLDENATRQAILNELDRLSQEAQPEDTVVVWFSGHAISEEGPAYLVPFDYDAKKGGTNGVGAEELHDRLRQIPASRKVAVLDTHVQQKMIDLATRDNAYTLCLAEDKPGHAAAETNIEGNRHGLFSYHLRQTLDQQPELPLAEINQRVRQAIARQGQFKQIPLLIGDESSPLLGTVDWQLYLECFQTALRQNFAAMTLDELQTLDQRLSQSIQSPFPPLFLSLGRGYIEKEAFGQAFTVLRKAREQAEKVGYADQALPLLLTIAQLRHQHYAEALTTLQETLKTPGAPALAETLPVVQKLPHRKIHALLVGVSKQADAGLPAAHGALNDVRGIERLLTKYLGAETSNIVTLTDKAATASAIGRAFADLLVRARDEPALFFFAGNGSFSADGEPTILPYDARQAEIPNDLLLSELAQLAGGSTTNLAAVIDASWASGDALPWGIPSHSRFVPAESRLTPATRDLRPIKKPKVDPDWQPDAGWQQIREQMEKPLKRLQIGRATLYPASIQAAFAENSLPPGVAVAEAEFVSPFDSKSPKICGALTSSLIHALIEMVEGQAPSLPLAPAPSIDREQGITYEDLLQSLRRKLKWLQPFFVGSRQAERLFSNVVQEEQVQAAIQDQMVGRLLRETEELIKRLLDRRNGQGAESWLDLGVVLAAQNRSAPGIAALEKAIDQRESAPPEICHEARYYLGRVLTQATQTATPSTATVDYGAPRTGDLDRAVSQLRDATLGDPTNAAAHYYLGLAIRTRVEQEQLVEAERAWRTYLDMGAPQGHKVEVREFLESRRAYSLGTGSGWATGPSTGGGTGRGTG
jgi:uncharacterized caspase-like protein